MFVKITLIYVMSKRMGKPIHLRSAIIIVILNLSIYDLVLPRKQVAFVVQAENS
jgi:hypothetical protein